MIAQDNRGSSFGQSKQSLLDLIIKKLRFGEIFKEIPENSFLVDLGCGFNGDFLKTISPKIKKGIGFDLSVSHKKLPPNIQLKSFNLSQKLPISSQTVEIVTILAVIEHVHNPQQLLEEAYRILKPTGKLIITTPSTYSKPLLEFLAFKLGVISKEEIMDHKQYFDLPTLKKSLQVTNFKNIRLHYFELKMNLFAVAKK